MTAVAPPPAFQQISRSPWAINGGQSLNGAGTDDYRMFQPRKTVPRTNSSSSINSNSSNSSTATITSAPQTNGGSVLNSGELPSWAGAAPKKRPQPKAPWPANRTEAQAGFSGMSAGRGQLVGGLNGSGPGLHSAAPLMQGGGIGQGMQRPMVDQLPAPGQPVLYLLSLNGTFERKTISVPFYPDSLRIGRQTNQKTVPTPANGFFDSKVLSRQHAEIWADRNGKIWIRDVKSSNGTFVNGTRLSQENRESEPHELVTADHLELGIDIVSEDQKTVVHHKVAAKVEHAGFVSTSTSVLDMNFGDLDPANGALMLAQSAGVGFRGRSNSQASIASNGRMMPASVLASQPGGMAHQRPFWLTPITTEQIVKRLHNEMRAARLQSQDLGRTQQFISALLSKDDIKDQDRPEAPEPPKQPMVNGNGVSFRTDGKPRFSDPPAPPPQQPLPEKPDVPSLHRGITERPKSHPSNTSPIRPDSQINQLLEALANARKEIDGQSARVRELEESLGREREARKLAEDLAKRLEESNVSRLNGSANKAVTGQDAELQEAFEPPIEILRLSPDIKPTSDSAKSLPEAAESAESTAALLNARIESMMSEIQNLKQQLDLTQQRADVAEAERDVDRKTLTEMVMQIRRDEEARRTAEQERLRSRSKRRTSSSRGRQLGTAGSAAEETLIDGVQATRETDDDFIPTLSRSNTITPQTGVLAQPAKDQVVVYGLPYASMLGVVLIGMGLMAYINGWQPQPRLER